MRDGIDRSLPSPLQPSTPAMRGFLKDSILVMVILRGLEVQAKRYGEMFESLGAGRPCIRQWCACTWCSACGCAVGDGLAPGCSQGGVIVHLV